MLRGSEEWEAGPKTWSSKRLSVGFWGRETGEVSDPTCDQTVRSLWNIIIISVGFCVAFQILYFLWVSIGQPTQVSDFDISPRVGFLKCRILVVSKVSDF